MGTFYLDNPYPKFFCFRNYWDWNFLSGLKTVFVNLHSDNFLSAKLDNDMCTFFVDNPDQKFFLIQNLLEFLHSPSSPHSLWTCSWLDWQTLFVKLHTDTFLSAKLDNDMSTFYVDNPNPKFLLFQKLLGCKSSYSSPHFIWINCLLDWKHFSWNCIATIFWAQNLTTTWVLFFVDNQTKNSFWFRSYQDSYTPILALISFEKNLC